VPIQIGRFTIRDYHAKKSILTATEVLRYSSNIGAAHIADMSGPEAQKAFMNALGMLKPLDIGLAEVGRVKYPSNWGRVQTFTIAFGHGMMVTPMHLVAAVGALATDGHYRKPHILKGESAKESPQPVLSPETVLQLRDLMRDVVTSGSGRSSAVLGGEDQR
jgi:cell division protein FtsI (penicillin-binding protein 3)